MEDFLIGGVIAILFLAPALLRPTVGRVVLSAMLVGGGLVNLVYTLPNAPGSLLDLVASAPIPPYRGVVSMAAARAVTLALVVAVVAFELSAGVLMLWRGPVARGALLAAGAWSLGMLPLIPPYGLPIGIALTGAPGLAALILARRTDPRSVFGLVAQARAARSGEHHTRGESPCRDLLSHPG